MHENFYSDRFSEIVNKVVDKLMLVSGVLALTWILAFLLVAIIDK